MTGSAAQQSSQDVTAALIAWHHAIGNQKTDGPGMVVDDAKRNVGHWIGAVFFPCDSLGGGRERAHIVDVIIGKNVLEDGGDALKPHTSVDVLRWQFLQL